MMKFIGPHNAVLLYRSGPWGSMWKQSN